MASTMADVAQLAGVSKKSVSNFFNDYPYMRQDTRERIAAAIEELNYKVNISARNLSAGKTGAIGLAVPELAHPYFAELAQAVVSAAQMQGLDVLVQVTDGDHAHEMHVLNGARGRSVDGLIFAPIALDGNEIDAATADVPLVLIGDLAREGRYDFVGVPNEAGAFEAVSHLLSRGRRRIVALGMENPGMPTAAGRRHHGYLRAFEKHDLHPDPALFLIPAAWNRAAGFAAMTTLIESCVAFDAVFGYNDALALGAISALQHHGLTVPDDVAVAGFDNVEEARFSTPALTTIESGRDWIAQASVARLIERLDEEHGQQAPSLQIAQHSLVVREST